MTAPRGVDRILNLRPLSGSGRFLACPPLDHPQQKVKDQQSKDQHEHCSMENQVPPVKALLHTFLSV